MKNWIKKKSQYLSLLLLTIIILFLACLNWIKNAIDYLLKREVVYKSKKLTL